MEIMDKLQHVMSMCKIEAVLITDPYNMRYISKYTGGTGYLFVTESKMYILTDSRYIEQAGLESPNSEIIDVAGYTYSQLVRMLMEKEKVTRLGFENRHISYLEYSKLISECSEDSLVCLDETINAFRNIKSPSEIKNIRKAESIGDGAFEYIINYINEKVTEQDIAVELEYYMKKHGASGLSFDTIVASGTNSSMPHASVTDKYINQGDFITMDFGCIYNGYCSDMTRTVGYGDISSEQSEIYDIVLEAQEAALEVIRPGVLCSEVDRVAREIIDDAGYGKYFGHGLGHSVGLFIHEEPRFSPKCDVILEPNMVITVEPGIYLPGKFGVRIEDLVSVTDDGYDNLTNSFKELTVL